MLCDVRLQCLNMVLRGARIEISIVAVIRRLKQQSEEMSREFASSYMFSADVLLYRIS